MRSAFDKLISFTGLALVAVLITAGGLLTWANTFIGDQVHDQLTMQGITMPEGEALAGLPKSDAAALEEFAGSALDTGPEAKAYSEHYILAHMNASSEELAGEVLPYAAVSAKARELGAAVAENPNATQAEIDEAAEWGALKQSLLDGSTLRGLLLYGYAFATIGTIAGIAAFVSFGGAALLLVLVLLGFYHARRAEHTAERAVPARAAQLV
jgi:hypothetical protein